MEETDFNKFSSLAKTKLKSPRAGDFVWVVRQKGMAKNSGFSFGKLNKIKRVGGKKKKGKKIATIAIFGYSRDGKEIVDSPPDDPIITISDPEELGMWKIIPDENQRLKTILKNLYQHSQETTAQIQDPRRSVVAAAADRSTVDSISAEVAAEYLKYLAATGTEAEAAFKTEDPAKQVEIVQGWMRDCLNLQSQPPPRMSLVYDGKVTTGTMTTEEEGNLARKKKARCEEYKRIIEEVRKQKEKRQNQRESAIQSLLSDPVQTTGEGGAATAQEQQKLSRAANKAQAEKMRRKEEERKKKEMLRREKQSRDDAAAASAASEAAPPPPARDSPTPELTAEQQKKQEEQKRRFEERRMAQISFQKSPAIWLIDRTLEIMEQRAPPAIKAALATATKELRQIRALWNDPQLKNINFDELLLIIYILKNYPEKYGNGRSLSIYGGIPRDLLLLDKKTKDIDIALEGEGSDGDDVSTRSWGKMVIEDWAKREGFSVTSKEKGEGVLELKLVQLPALEVDEPIGGRADEPAGTTNRDGGLEEKTHTDTATTVASPPAVVPTVAAAAVAVPTVPTIPTIDTRMIDVELTNQKYFKEQAARKGRQWLPDFDVNNLRLVFPGTGVGIGSGRMFRIKSMEGMDVLLEGLTRTEEEKAKDQAKCDEYDWSEEMCREQEIFKQLKISIRKQIMRVMKPFEEIDANFNNVSARIGKYLLRGWKIMVPIRYAEDTLSRRQEAAASLEAAATRHTQHKQSRAAEVGGTDLQALIDAQLSAGQVTPKTVYRPENIEAELKEAILKGAVDAAKVPFLIQKREEEARRIGIQKKDELSNLQVKTRGDFLELSLPFPDTMPQPNGGGGRTKKRKRKKGRSRKRRSRKRRNGKKRKRTRKTRRKRYITRKKRKRKRKTRKK